VTTPLYQKSSLIISFWLILVPKQSCQDRSTYSKYTWLTTGYIIGSTSSLKLLHRSSIEHVCRWSDQIKSKYHVHVKLDLELTGCGETPRCHAKEKSHWPSGIAIVSICLSVFRESTCSVVSLMVYCYRCWTAIYMSKPICLFWLVSNQECIYSYVTVNVDRNEEDLICSRMQLAITISGHKCQSKLWSWAWQRLTGARAVVQPKRYLLLPCFQRLG